MSGSGNLRKITGGLSKRERAAWARPCRMTHRATVGPTVAIIETLSGPEPVCADHVAVAEYHGYRVISREAPGAR